VIADIAVIAGIGKANPKALPQRTQRNTEESRSQVRRRLKKVYPVIGEIMTSERRWKSRLWKSAAASGAA